jgi:phage tail sheath protein FI
MPVSVSYPGVYLEEIPSGVRTITGVATSVTAFIGGAPAGPVDDPVTINSYGDFERTFGGLAVDYPMSYAVRDFYLNGGSQALIVRLFVDPTNPAGDGVASFAIDDLVFAASSPGKWGNDLAVSIDFDVPKEVKDNLGAPVFNLTVRLGTAVEKFLNLTVGNNARRVDRVLKSSSNWLRWKGDWPATAPTLTKAELAVTKLAAESDALDAAAADFATAKATTPALPQADIDAAKAKLDAAKKAYDDDYKLVAATGGGGAESDPLDAAAYIGKQIDKSGIFALDKADLFNLLCILPQDRDGDVPASVYQAAMAYCAQRRAMLIVDPPTTWDDNPVTAASTARDGLAALGLGGDAARNAALYFPRLLEADPLRGGQTDSFVPCGAIAGVMARTDVARGVWKAPAGLSAAINGIQGFTVNLNDAENGMLNPLGINCLRSFPVNGRVVWGARTLRGADALADEYKYVPVRRLALYIEESVYRGTQWVVFEPNDEPLWSQIRLNLGAFMNGLFRQGAFQGKTPQEAYFVKCDKETTTQNDVNLGIVNVVIGFAPLKPAEFVIIKLQQIAGQIQV